MIQEKVRPVATDSARYLGVDVVTLAGFENKIKRNLDADVVIVHDIIDLNKSTATSTVIWTPFTIFLHRKRMFMLRACYTLSGGAELMSCRKRTLDLRFKTESCPTVSQAREFAISYIGSFLLPKL